jgi:hypothetical protein
MLKGTRLLLLALVVSIAGVARAGLAQANDFVFDAKVNKEVAKRLAIPVYFTVPASARLALPKDIDATDRLIDFRHPDGLRSNTKVGLRLVVAQRAGLPSRLAKSGLVQTGDLLLTFRAEWGGVGAYPNVQMGISHTGIAYVKDGVVHNLDNPLTEEYLGKGMRAELDSEQYTTLKFIHVVRPRNLTDEQRANLVAWATLFNSGAKRIYPSQISFNENYNDPKYKPGQPLDFVQHIARAALGQNPEGTVALFCSEFAWSVLALRDCDPATSADDFKGDAVPSCVRPIMRPMSATGNYVSGKSRTSYTGLGDGPLVVINSLKLTDGEREHIVKALFVPHPDLMNRMSDGHRELAQSMQPAFEKLKTYYSSATNGAWLGLKARLIGAVISDAIPQNYSPTSFLINTLLPRDNANRTMDYVATIYLE